MSMRRGIQSGSGRKLLSPHSCLVSKDKKEKTTGRLPVVGWRCCAMLITTISILVLKNCQSRLHMRVILRKAL